MNTTPNEGDGVLRIAVPLYQYKWVGGLDFVAHLISGILMIQDHVVPRLYLLIPDDSVYLPYSLSGFFAKLRYLVFHKRRMKKRNRYTADFYRKFFFGFSKSVTFLPHNQSKRGLTAALLHAEISVLFPVLRPYVTGFPVPWVAYITDLQHNHLSNNFSIFQRIFRNAGFSILLRIAKVVIVNSRTTAEDIKQHFPQLRAEIISLPFSPGLRDRPQNHDDPSLSSNNKFFIVSNQFWQHKSHATVVRALVVLKQKYGMDDIDVYFTGDTGIPGNKYLRRIEDLILELEVKEHIQILGMIDKKEQLRMMEMSVAVVQPSLFEGGPGGGSAAEAVSLGVPLILSDIPINEEVEGSNIYFFESENSDGLASLMASLLREPPERPQLPFLLEQEGRNLLNLGKSILSAVTKTFG